MSSNIKRNLYNVTNENKYFKNDSIIEELKINKSKSLNSTSESLIDDDSIILDDDNVFDEELVSLLKTSQNQNRKRLNGTSTYRIKENKNKRKNKYIKKENIIIDQTLNQLREEQTRIDAHSLSIIIK